MLPTSNLRKLLTDSKLGLLPHLENRLQQLETSFGNEQANVQIQPYDIQLGGCNTITANEPRPFIIQSTVLKFALTGDTDDKLELLLFASQLQNNMDAAILEWSNSEWHQFEKPLKRPVTQITGGLEYAELDKPANTCRINIYREFDLTYTITF